VGTEFVFALEIPALQKPLELRGKVIWTISEEEATKANPAGMGIEFQYADEAERREKETAVERLFTDQLGEHLVTKLLGRRPQT
jgi:type IV pilus assembly protein PilZ